MKKCWLYIIHGQMEIRSESQNSLLAKTALLGKGLREAGQTAANAFRTFADSRVD